MKVMNVGQAEKFWGRAAVFDSVHRAEEKGAGSENRSLLMFLSWLEARRRIGKQEASAHPRSWEGKE